MNSSLQQYPLPLPHDEAMGADDFMVTDSNREAAAWLAKYPNWPSHCVVLFGPSGCGKTHLAQVWQSQNNAQSLTLKDLIAQDATTLSAQNKTLVLDDADLIAGNVACEEALFHLYNHLRESGGHLLLTSKRAPAQWQIRLLDLHSRLSSIPAVAIAAPDDALLSGLLIKQFRDRQIEIAMDVDAYLVPRIPRTPATIRALVARLDETSLSERRVISIALARRLIEDQSFLISP